MCSRLSISDEVDGLRQEGQVHGCRMCLPAWRARGWWCGQCGTVVHRKLEVTEEGRICGWRVTWPFIPFATVGLLVRHLAGKILRPIPLECHLSFLIDGQVYCLVPPTQGMDEVCLYTLRPRDPALHVYVRVTPPATSPQLTGVAVLRRRLWTPPVSGSGPTEQESSRPPPDTSIPAPPSRSLTSVPRAGDGESESSGAVIQDELPCTRCLPSWCLQGWECRGCSSAVSLRACRLGARRLVVLDDVPEASWVRVWDSVPFVTVGRLLRYLASDVFDHPEESLVVIIGSVGYVLEHEPEEPADRVALWALVPDDEVVAARVRVMRSTRLRLRAVNPG